nr:ABC transporter substrate-binding protein [uncultured Methanospirillum sp.]
MMLLVTSTLAFADRTITDGRGKQVTVPDQINRVITISDGMVEAVLYSLGEMDTLVGTGTPVINTKFSWSYPSIKGENITLTPGSSVIQTLYPKFNNITVVSKLGTPPNYEKIAELKPDVVFIRAGDCNYFGEIESMNKAIDTLESMGIPVVLTYGPNSAVTTGVPLSLDTFSKEVQIIGSVFGKDQEAKKIASYLEKSVQDIKTRTADIADDQKPKVLIFGMSAKKRGDGGAGGVYGSDTLENYMIEDIVHAKNAYQDKGDFKTINAEQVIATEPDVIVLSTAHGYHPVREIQEAPYYQVLKDMKAIKENRLSSMPWLPANCDKRESYPIEAMVIAKAAYPEKFADIDLGDWLINFYKNVYNVDDTMAKNIASAQMMDWAFSS